MFAEKRLSRQMLRLVLAGSVAVLTILMAVACGGGDSPTSTVARDSSGSSEVTAVPTSTVARDSSGNSEVTVAEYAVWCAETAETSFPESGLSLTWGQAAEDVAEGIDAYEDMSAPEELKAFHDATTALLKAVHDFIRMQDASEPYDNASVRNDEINARAEALFNVAETLDGETSSQLYDVDCVFS